MNGAIDMETAWKSEQQQSKLLRIFLRLSFFLIFFLPFCLFSSTFHSFFAVSSNMTMFLCNVSVYVRNFWGQKKRTCNQTRMWCMCKRGKDTQKLSVSVCDSVCLQQIHRKWKRKKSQSNRIYIHIHTHSSNIMIFINIYIKYSVNVQLHVHNIY